MSSLEISAYLRRIAFGYIVLSLAWDHALVKVYLIMLTVDIWLHRFGVIKSIKKYQSRLGIVLILLINEEIE